MLDFPNPSRIYDAARHCVCFWGYDNCREIAFSVDESALTKLHPGMASNETASLETFDSHHRAILDVARKLYRSGPQTRYTIS